LAKNDMAMKGLLDFLDPDDCELESSAENRIFLSPADSLMTKEKADAFHIVSGSVRIFVTWTYEDGCNGRRVFLGILPEGKTIPALAFKDEDESGQSREWHFLLETLDGAEILWHKGMATKVAQINFLQDIAEATDEHKGHTANVVEIYQREGQDFGRAMVEYYEWVAARDYVFIMNGEKGIVSAKNDAYDIIANVFNEGIVIGAGHPIYRAVAYACHKSGIPIKDIKKLSEYCGEDITVPNIAEASQFICRSVVLKSDWYKNDCGTLVADWNGKTVACIPGRYGHYKIFDGEEREAYPLTKEIAQEISLDAYAISRALPHRELRKKDLIDYSFKSIRRADIMLVCALALAGALVGVLIPTLNQKIYDEYIPLGDLNQLVQICTVIASFMVGSLFFDIVKNLAEFRISSHVGYDLQGAVYHRVFMMPERFFRSYDSADLGQRLEYISQFSNKYISAFLVSGVSLVTGLLYLYKMFKYSAKMSWIALLMLLIYGLIMAAISLRAMRFDASIEQRKGESSGKLYQFITGIEKVRMAGAEERAVNEYIMPFRDQQNTEMRKGKVLAVETMLSGVVTSIFSMVFYLLIVKSKLQLSAGTFMAFNSAFGAFSGVALKVITEMLDVYELRPMYERFRAIIETAPEDNGEGEAVGTLSGAIQIENVHFSYDGVNEVLRGIDLKIEAGEYVGIVGTSGCGKSTLMKLLLGFEVPGRGRIRYDDKDLATLDKKSFRRKLGVVLQNGKLIAGSILENIRVTAPHASMTEVRNVVEAVGLSEDIQRMPMGLQTVLGDSSGTISGGQRQRILIARAIISNPSVLIFDEATSALDNLTQALVCENLEKMKITRIAVAHRLSTVINCDRIVVMDEGRIVESGTYESLMARKGRFYELASRQIS